MLAAWVMVQKDIQAIEYTTEARQNPVAYSYPLKGFRLLGAALLGATHPARLPAGGRTSGHGRPFRLKPCFLFL